MIGNIEAGKIRYYTSISGVGPLIQLKILLTDRLRKSKFEFFLIPDRRLFATSCHKIRLVAFNGKVLKIKSAHHLNGNIHESELGNDMSPLAFFHHNMFQSFAFL